MSKKYKVTKDCYGFKGRYWTENSVVDLEDDEHPPSHFELIDPSKIDSPKSPEKDDPMKPQPIQIGKPIRPKGGFAAKTNLELPKEVETAGKVLKKNKN